jgi:hypothetical protein
MNTAQRLGNLLFFSRGVTNAVQAISQSPHIDPTTPQTTGNQNGLSSYFYTTGSP